MAADTCTTNGAADKRESAQSSSGNVARNTGHPNPDLKQAGSSLAYRIVAVLDKHGLSVRNGDLGRFAPCWLMKFLAALDGGVPDTLGVGGRCEEEMAMTKCGRL